jgi:hypothetical protein
VLVRTADAQHVKEQIEMDSRLGFSALLNVLVRTADAQHEKEQIEMDF